MMARQLPPGIRLLSVEEVGSNSPSLQSQVRWAEYQARVNGVDAGPLRHAISSMLGATTLPSEYRREKIEEFMSHVPCPKCKGARLRPEALAVTVGEKNIYEFTELSVTDAGSTGCMPSTMN